MGMKNEYINRVGRSRKLPVLLRKEPIFEISEPYRSIIDGILVGWEGMEHIKDSVNVSYITKQKINSKVMPLFRNNSKFIFLIIHLKKYGKKNRYSIYPLNIIFNIINIFLVCKVRKT